MAVLLLGIRRVLQPTRGQIPIAQPARITVSVLECDTDACLLSTVTNVILILSLKDPNCRSDFGFQHLKPSIRFSAIRFSTDCTLHF